MKQKSFPTNRALDDDHFHSFSKESEKVKTKTFYCPYTDISRTQVMLVWPARNYKLFTMVAIRTMPPRYMHKQDIARTHAAFTPSIHIKTLLRWVEIELKLKSPRKIPSRSPLEIVFERVKSVQGRTGYRFVQPMKMFLHVLGTRGSVGKWSAATTRKPSPRMGKYSYKTAKVE